MPSNAQYSSDSRPSRSIGSPFRRRRVLFFASCLALFLFFYCVPWSLPPTLRGLKVSRASVASLLKSKKGSVGEIYGVLHLVTGDGEQEHVLSNAVHLDPMSPIDMSIYASGFSSSDWVKEKQKIDKEHPIIVFSKTYCSFSLRAKKLLEAYDIQPAPKVIEVDIRDDGNIIKQLLSRLTKHSTFPNILLGGTSIGGYDDLLKLHDDKKLPKMFQDVGATPQADGSGIDET